MNTPFEVWLLQDKCELPPLERTKALKMRLGRGEDKFLLLNDQFGRVLILQIPIMNLEGPKPSFYRSKGRSWALQSLYHKLPKSLLS